MLAGREPPEEGCVRHWNTLKVAHRSEVTCFIAGAAVGVEVHFGAQSKPCLRVYCGAKRKCWGCDAQLRRGWLAYLPVYLASDESACVAAFHTGMKERLRVVGLHQRVKIGREEARNSGLWIRAEGQVRYNASDPARQGGADVAEWLPTLWKLKDVITPDMLRKREEVLAAAAASHTSGSAGVTLHKPGQDPPATPSRVWKETRERIAKKRDAGLPVTGRDIFHVNGDGHVGE